MRKGKGKIALEGLPYIGVLGLIAWITALLGLTILSLIFGALALFTLYFFRDPERETPKEPYAVIAPADGRVIEVERSLEGDFLNREMMRIGIFLSVTDCHINRFPVTGRVIGTRYIPGGFKKAYLESASKENERLATLVETEDKDEIVIVQVAGFIARRIVSYVSPGDVVERGERFGMIKFGSRVDLYLPLRCEVTAAVGDRVRGGETIIGWLKEKEA
ncbi:MAG TPA: phosphatidylserine decarboxylase family protein [Thermodesulfobacteriota bacterium]|nr:phosphatidylserine decarboxylase family protein [Thermodesulfobacteriota bacterium]